MNPPNTRRATVADVARLAGTSTAVVSYVINDGPRPVAAPTRERVTRAIAELGFRPSRAARALRVRHSEFIGLVVPGTSDPYYVQLGHAVEAAATRRGYLTMTGNSGFRPEQEAALLKALIDENVAGLVIAGLGDSRDLDRILAAGGTRAIFMHHRPDNLTGSLVTVDNRGWAARAVGHLTEHGHSAVACLTHEDDAGPVGERYAGWQDAMRAAGADDRQLEALTVRAPIDRAGASAAVADWLVSHDRPSAVFVATDEQAFGLLHRAALVGVRIPDDLAVVAFDGVRESAMTVPELSTVEEPFTQIGERAVQLLLDDVPGEPTELFECELVRRRSCGCG